MQLGEAWIDTLSQRHALVIAAHPDDETIGASAALGRLAACTVLHVTDGAPRDTRFIPEPYASDPTAYAEVRREEAEAALDIVGIGTEHIVRACITDQEVALQMAPLAWTIRSLIEHLAPDVLITHAYEGGHPDHDATAFAAHAAVALLLRAGRDAPPIIEMTSYHAAGGSYTLGRFIPHPGSTEWTLRLSAQERQRKRQMLACYASQRGRLDGCPIDRESFRPAPAYHFLRPPHPGRLYYEQIGIGVSAEGFCALVQRALGSLQLSHEQLDEAVSA